MCHPISLIKFEKMKKTLLIKKPSRSLLIESEEVSDTDECAPNTLNGFIIYIDSISHFFIRFRDKFFFRGNKEHF